MFRALLMSISNVVLYYIFIIRF